MANSQGFMFPRSASGEGSIIPNPPWHYSGTLLTLEYRTGPAAVASLLPDGLDLADEDPGALAMIWADWQSCSDSFEELLDPMRAQYMEVFLVCRVKYKGQHYSRCLSIWVDRDYAMARGNLQGYPKKLGSAYMTRPATVGKAGPRLEAGGKFGATLAAYDRRLAEATFTITGESEGAGFVNALPMLHHRYMPAIEVDGTDSLSELVTMSGVDADIGRTFVGDFDLSLFESPTEQLHRVQPQELIAGYYREVGVTWNGGTTLERQNLTEI